MWSRAARNIESRYSELTSCGRSSAGNIACIKCMAGGLPSFFTGWFSCFRRPVADDAHRDCRDPADDFGFGWVIEGANFLVRMRVRDDDQPSTVDLAPAAHISIPQLGEIRGGEAFDLLQLLNTGHSGTLS